MNEQARQARNEYMRQWRKKNPDKVRAIKARYWEKKATKIQEVQHENEKK